MPAKDFVEDTAASTGFERTVVEKVIMLTLILRGLREHELIRNWWLLKGGTALNLLYLEVPRLSVDIDLNFIGVSSLNELPNARRLFESALVTVCEREKCAVKRIPTSHAGGKLRLRFESVFGGGQNLEVDVNYLARIPVLGKTEETCKFPPRNLVKEEFRVPTLALDELAAGKFTALIARFAARDAYDAYNLLTMKPALLQGKNFRIAFLCYAASSRLDIRTVDVSSFTLSQKEIREKLIPLLQKPKTDEKLWAAELADKLTNTVTSAVQQLTDFSKSERSFLDLFLERGEINAEVLTSDRELQARIAEQPMLLWKQQHIRARLK